MGSGGGPSAAEIKNIDQFTAVWSDLDLCFWPGADFTFEDTAGVNPAEDSDLIARLEPHTDSNFTSNTHLLQTTAGFQPTWTQSDSTVNDMPTMDFDGTDDFLEVDQSRWPTSDWTDFIVVMVYKLNATSSGRDALYGADDSGQDLAINNSSGSMRWQNFADGSNWDDLSGYSGGANDTDWHWLIAEHDTQGGVFQPEGTTSLWVDNSYVGYAQQAWFESYGDFDGLTLAADSGQNNEANITVALWAGSNTRGQNDSSFRSSLDSAINNLWGI
jgi:hypothetical protein